MNPNQQPRGDQHLDTLLGEWVVDAPLPQRFQDLVWHRIAQTGAQAESGFRAGLLRLVEIVLPRPRIAFSYLAILLLLGVAAGSVAAQIRSSRLNAALSQRYVQSLDPYRAEATRP